MKKVQRREFISTSTKAAGAAAVAATFSIDALGANEKIVVAMMGVAGRGNKLIDHFLDHPDVEIKYIADVDSRLFKSRSRHVVEKAESEGKPGKDPLCVQDFRTILEDKDLDAVVNATPDHWHSLGTIVCCQAGKDVYVEKPLSHSVWEGRRTVEAARKYKRVVQIGTQNRSGEYHRLVKEYIESGKLGDVHLAKVFNSKKRNSIGFQPNSETPEGLDYDMWLGPAPLRPFNENRFHYAWHWFWEYSGGDIINDGVHQLDVARWLLGVGYPQSVYSSGGIHFFNDDQEPPDTQMVIWDYPKLTLVFEQELWSPYMKKTPMELRLGDNLPSWPFNGTRVELHGTKQKLFVGRHGGGWEAFDADGKTIAKEPGNFDKMMVDHIANFVDCIRSRKLPNGDVEHGHISTNLCHHANTSYRLGRKLFIDPKTEGYKNDDEANTYVKRTYRSPWEVPENV